jgi:excinuclease UvrABC nuclease subunit
VIAIAQASGEYCVALMFVRGGGASAATFFPKAPFAEPPEVLAAFVSQYYLEREAPAEIIVEHDFEEAALLEATLAPALRTRCASPPRCAASAPLARDDARQCRAGAADARTGAGQHRVRASRTCARR